MSDDNVILEAENMLEWICGDRGPDLEHWNPRDWLNLQMAFNRLQAEVRRLTDALEAAERDSERLREAVYALLDNAGMGHEKWREACGIARTALAPRDTSRMGKADA